MTSEGLEPVRYHGWRELFIVPSLAGAMVLVGWVFARQLDQWYGWMLAVLGLLFLVTGMWHTLGGTWLTLDAEGITMWRRGRTRRIPWSDVRDIEAGDWNGPSIVRVLVRDRTGSEDWVDVTPVGNPGVYRVRDRMRVIHRRAAA